MLNSVLAGTVSLALISGVLISGALMSHGAGAADTYRTKPSPAAAGPDPVQRPVDPGIFDPTRVTAYRPERPVSANGQSVEKPLATPPAAPDLGKAAPKTGG